MARSEHSIRLLQFQAGALDPVEVADARMEYDLECSGYNVRQFLGTVSAPGTLGETGNAVMGDILALVDEIEQQTDAVLDGQNEEGWEEFQKKLAVCQQSQMLHQCQCAELRLHEASESLIQRRQTQVM